MKRRTFFGWLGAVLGTSQVSTVTREAQAAPPLPGRVPRPAYQVDGMPRWQHHAPVDVHAPRYPGQTQTDKRVAFLRNPAKAAPVSVGALDWQEYSAALQATAGQVFPARVNMMQPHRSLWHGEVFDFETSPRDLDQGDPGLPEAIEI